MKFARLEARGHGKYWTGRWSDSYLSVLSSAFGDSALDVERLIEELQVPGSQGIGGNYVDIFFEGDDVLIGSQHDKDESDRISILREQLWKLLHEWQELVKKNPDEIILYRDDEYNIWFKPKFKNQ